MTTPFGMPDTEFRALVDQCREPSGAINVGKLSDAVFPGRPIELPGGVAAEVRAGSAHDFELLKQLVSGTVPPDGELRDALRRLVRGADAERLARLTPPDVIVVLAIACNCEHVLAMVATEQAAKTQAANAQAATTPTPPTAAARSKPARRRARA